MTTGFTEHHGLTENGLGSSLSNPALPHDVLSIQVLLSSLLGLSSFLNISRSCVFFPMRGVFFVLVMMLILPAFSASSDMNGLHQHSVELNNQALEAMKQRDLDGAIKLLQEALRIQPDYAIADTNLKIATSQRNSQVQLIQIEKKDSVGIYAFSTSVLDATINCAVAGSNAHFLPSSTVKRGLSKDMDDPIIEAVRIDPTKPISCVAGFDWHIGSCSAKPDVDHVYMLPYEIGKSYEVTLNHFSKTHKVHSANENAVDFRMPVGTVVCASRAGTVVALEDEKESTGPGQEPNYITIKHDDGTYGMYAHLRYHGIVTPLGSRVEAGQCLGLSGNTGESTGPHLHFGIFYYDSTDRIVGVPPLLLTQVGLVRSPRIGQLLENPGWQCKKPDLFLFTFLSDRRE